MKFSMELEEITLWIPRGLYMAPKEKNNFWGNYTSYGHEILLGARWKHFRVTYDIQVIIFFFFFFFLAFCSQRMCLCKIVHFPPLRLNLIEVIELKVEILFFHNFCYHFENVSGPKNLHGNIIWYFFPYFVRHFIQLSQYSLIMLFLIV